MNNLTDIKNEVHDYLKNCGVLDIEYTDADIEAVAERIKELRDEGKIIEDDDFGHIVYDVIF